MKRIISLAVLFALFATLALTAISCDKKTEEPDKAEVPDNVVIVDTADTLSKPATAPGSSYIYTRGKLSLAKDAAYENGMLVLYFNESLQYNELTECYIGMMDEYNGDSVISTPVPDAYADMLLDDGNYCGIALLPSSELVAGKYTFSVSIGTYVVDSFEFTVE